MDRATAEKITSLAKQADALFGEVELAIQTISDPKEQRELRRALGNLILDVHEGLVLPTVRQYPDLHPDGRHGAPY